MRASRVGFGSLLWQREVERLIGSWERRHCGSTGELPGDGTKATVTADVLLGLHSFKALSQTQPRSEMGKAGIIIPILSVGKLRLPRG